MPTVLLVEDDPAMRRLLTHLLQRELGCEVRVAEHGLAGYELAKLDRPDLILFDVGLPVMDGEEMLDALRKDPVTADIPCVAVSGQGQRPLIERLLVLGITDFLLKPIALPVATQRLRQVLDALAEAAEAARHEARRRPSSSPT